MKRAALRLIATVDFEDNGEDDLKDQAFEAMAEKYGFSPEQDFEAAEIIGQVEEVFCAMRDAGGEGRGDTP